MTKPIEILRWSDDDPGTTRDEPSEGEKDTGWIADDIPSHGIMNWLIGVPGDWIAWLATRVFDGYVQPTEGSDCILTGDPDEGLLVKNDAGSRLPVCGSELWLGAVSGLTRLKDSSGELRVTNAADALVPSHASTVYGTAFRLDANYDSVICVPLGSGHPTEVGGAKWTRAAGTPPELWLSAAASGSLTFDVQVPHGSKVAYIMVDWQAHAASPGTKMRFSAQKHGVTLAGSDGEGVAGEDFLQMLSTTNVPAQASTSRKWALMTTDQNNTGFDNSIPNPWRVRVRIEASTEAGADMVYGVYVVCTHRSVGHLSLAPNVT